MLRLRHSLCALLVAFAFVGYSFDVECLLGHGVCPDSCQTQVSDACAQPVIAVTPQSVALPFALVDYVGLATSCLTGRLPGQPTPSLLRPPLICQISSRGPPA
ncbi:MAG: hypothetical protein AB7S38_23885 [Vulcanimicrobiota bacterium]